MLKEFHWPVRVYYDDTDAGGIVYHANYLKMMEHARTEWLRQLGFEQDRLLAEQNRVFTVVSLEVNYLKPARFNDALIATASVGSIRPARLQFHQEVRRGDAVLCKAGVWIACLKHPDMKPVRLPLRLVEELTNGP
ncbi:MAG: tol-pal system-associated acyl-CoA thioesterase [Pseudomonadota bacterium]|nr:tol-pal system-associated acyl-CoA thioesterase [Pseudomonadota bacterium]